MGLFPTAFHLPFYTMRIKNHLQSNRQKACSEENIRRAKLLNVKLPAINDSQERNGEDGSGDISFDKASNQCGGKNDGKKQGGYFYIFQKSKCGQKNHCSRSNTDNAPENISAVCMVVFVVVVVLCAHMSTSWYNNGAASQDCLVDRAL